MKPLTGNFHPGRLAERIDRWSVRERLLVLLAFCLVIGVIVKLSLLDPTASRGKALRADLSQAEQTISSLTLKKAEILSRSTIDPDRINRQRILALKRDIDGLDERLKKQALELLSPEDMPVILEGLLKRHPGIKLVRLENLAPVALFEDQSGPDGDALKVTPAAYGRPNVYRHDVVVELEGSYLDTLRYLGSVDRLQQKVFLDEVTIEIISHPKARVRMTWHTLSLQEGWIGV